MERYCQFDRIMKKKNELEKYKFEYAILHMSTSVKNPKAIKEDLEKSERW